MIAPARTLFIAVLLCAALPACKSTSSSSPYVSNSEAGYNPYPGDSSPASGSLLPPSHSSQSSRYVPQYEQAVPPPPPGFDSPNDPGTFQEAPAPVKKSSSVASTTKTSSNTSKPKPKATTTKKTSTVAKKKPSTSGKIHTVVKGDTLYALALRNKTTVAKIKALNGMSTDKLSIGKKLKMP